MRQIFVGNTVADAMTLLQCRYYAKYELSGVAVVFWDAITIYNVGLLSQHARKDFVFTKIANRNRQKLKCTLNKPCMCLCLCLCWCVCECRPCAPVAIQTFLNFIFKFFIAELILPLFLQDDCERNYMYAFTLCAILKSLRKFKGENPSFISKSKTIHTRTRARRFRSGREEARCWPLASNPCTLWLTHSTYCIFVLQLHLAKTFEKQAKF